MDDDMIAQFGSGVDDDAWIDVAIGADFYTRANDRSRSNARARSDQPIRFNNGVWANRDLLSQGRCRIDDSGRIKARSRNRRFEQTCSPGKGELWLRSEEQGFVRRRDGQLRGDDDGRCTRCQRGGKTLRVLGEDQRCWRRGMNGGDVLNLDVITSRAASRTQLNSERLR